MTIGAWLEQDLLRRRREDSGAVALRPVSAKALLLRGTLIGSGLLALVLVVIGGAVFFSQWLKMKEADLTQDALAYDRYQSQVIQTDRLQRELQKSNEALATAVSGIRSGSALLSEISRLMPKAVQLLKLKVQSATLELSGIVFQPAGLDQVNALQIQLEESLFFDNKGVVLKKVIEGNSSSVGSSMTGLQLKTPEKTSAPKKLLFDLVTSFPKDESKLTQKVLQQLGSFGLARRVNLLRRYELLP